jgi:hypothetical protein
LKGEFAVNKKKADSIHLDATLFRVRIAAREGDAEETKENLKKISEYNKRKLYRMNALRRSSRTSRKNRIRIVTTVEPLITDTLINEHLQ